MNFKSELFHVNQKLARNGIKLRIEQRGSRLGLRGPLPCQKDPKKSKDQRISLGLDSDVDGLNKAQQTLNFIYLQIQHKQFNWENWSKQKPKTLPNSIDSDVQEVIKAFKLYFFNDPIRMKSRAGSRTNWDYAYLPYLRRLKKISYENNQPLNKDLFLKTLLTYSESSRSRQQCGVTLKAFANYLNIELPIDWKKMAYGYGLNKAKYRELPNNKLIEDIYHLIPNNKPI